MTPKKIKPEDMKQIKSAALAHARAKIAFQRATVDLESEVLEAKVSAEFVDLRSSFNADGEEIKRSKHPAPSTPAIKPLAPAQHVVTPIEA